MQLRKYQFDAVNFLLDGYKKRPGSGLWLSCGLGKTVVILKTLELLKEYRQGEKFLIVAPARVIETSWLKEIREWGIELSYSRELLEADITFVNTESLSLRSIATKKEQLAQKLIRQKFNADVLVIDEITKFKNWSASRTKVLRKLLPRFKYRVTMTGSPTPNSLGEIFPQHFAVDLGQTLSAYIGHFRDIYMRSCGYENREWEMRPEMVKPLQEKLAPWYLCQEAIDHLDMPELIQNVIDVELPPKVLAAYKGVEREMFAELETGETITALSGSSRYNLCRQMASGCVYGEDRSVCQLHTAKLDAIGDLFEELNGRSLLVAYWYIHEGDMLADKFPHAARIDGRTNAEKTVEIIRKWQKGEISMILAQASSISHGIDGLQKNCNDLCWFTLTDNPDIRHQLEARLYRQGVEGGVRIHYLAAKSTIDRTVLRVLNGKAANQLEVIKAIKELRGAY